MKLEILEWFLKKRLCRGNEELEGLREAVRCYAVTFVCEPLHAPSSFDGDPAWPGGAPQDWDIHGEHFCGRSRLLGLPGRADLRLCVRVQGCLERFMRALNGPPLYLTSP